MLEWEPSRRANPKDINRRTRMMERKKKKKEEFLKSKGKKRWRREGEVAKQVKVSSG